MDTIETMERAMALLNEGDHAGAQAACNAVLDEEIDNPDAHYLLGVIEYQRRNYELAEQLVQKAIAIEGTAPWYFIALAEVRTARGDFPRAIEALQQSILLK